MSTLYIKKHHGFSNSHISDKQYALSSPLTNHSVLIHAYFKVNPSTRNDKALLHVNMNIIYKQKVDWLKFAHTSSKSIIYSKHNIIIYEKKPYILLGLIICPKILQMFNSKYHHIRNNISWKYIQNNSYYNILRTCHHSSILVLLLRHNNMTRFCFSHI